MARYKTESTDGKIGPQRFPLSKKIPYSSILRGKEQEEAYKSARSSSRNKQKECPEVLYHLYFSPLLI